MSTPEFRVTFATCADLPDLDADDHHAVAALRKVGVEVRAAVWEDPGERWDDDAIILRSCWDAHLKTRAFRQWLESRSGSRMWNSPRTALWNLHKGYLLELSERGLPIIETHLVRSGTSVDLEAIVRERNWSAFVLKPAVSLTGYRTHCFQRDALDEARANLAAQLAEHDVLLQRFRPEVMNGEWSFVFIERNFSHCVLKVPAPNEFRSQVEYGGLRRRVYPSPGAIARARRVLDAVDEPLLYARVDGLLVDGAYKWMELEVIDPSLFLTECPGAEDTFARAVLRRLRAESRTGQG